MAVIAGKWAGKFSNNTGQHGRHGCLLHLSRESTFRIANAGLSSKAKATRAKPSLFAARRPRPRAYLRRASCLWLLAACQLLRRCYVKRSQVGLSSIHISSSAR